MPEKTGHLVRKEIEEFLDLEARRKAANRLADDLEKQAEVLKAKIWEFVEAKGGDARSVERSGFVLAIHQKAGTVSWKTEFIREKGPVEAAKLVAACPKKDYLVVEPKA